jgi:hypothetical protein
MAAASLVSPGVSGPKLPSASARIWYSAFWHIAIEAENKLAHVVADHGCAVPPHQHR